MSISGHHIVDPLRNSFTMLFAWTRTKTDIHEPVSSETERVIITEQIIKAKGSSTGLMVITKMTTEMGLEMLRASSLGLL